MSSFGAGKLYGDHDFLEERHRHRFEVKRLLQVLSFSVECKHRSSWGFSLLVF